MDNELHKRFVGDNIHVNLNMKLGKLKHHTLQIILFLLLIFIMVLIPVGLSPSNEFEKEVTFAIVFLSILIVAFPIRYFYWNLYGKENLIINLKSISYNHEYGFIKTNLKTIPTNDLGIKVDIRREEGNKRYGVMQFFDYDELTDLPDLIHETTILIEESKLEELSRDIQRLYTPKDQFIDINYDFLLN